MGRATRLLFMLTCVLLGGFGCSVPEPAVSGMAEPPSASLDAFYDGGTLTVRLKNTSRVPLVVDKELVFLLHVRVAGAEVVEVAPSGVRHASTRGRVSADRFASIMPGASMTRVLDLRNDFAVFRYGVGYVWVGGEARPAAITAYEALEALAEKKTPTELIVTYAAYRYFRRAFKHYTGLAADELGLYEGPLKAVVAIIGEASKATDG